jgi:hypothetical protein
LERYLATNHQHNDDHRDLADALPVQHIQNIDSESAEIKRNELIRADQGPMAIS